MFNFKSSKYLTSILTVTSFFTFTNAASAITDFGNWSTFGDVTTTTNTTSLSSNALANDDSPNPDTNYNFSGSGAIPASDLETDLGLTPQSLDPDPNNLIQATEGSGLSSQLTVTEPTTLNYSWRFLTNDSTDVDNNGFSYADYAFVSIDGNLQTLASTDSTLNSSATNYVNEATGTYTRVFSPGTYDIAFGVVDVQDTNLSSALVLDNASASVPFEFTPGFSLVAIALCGGFSFYRRKLKN